MTTQHFSTLIVGGGIGGLGTALALARSGREVRLVEAAPEFTEVGAGLQIGPNATRSLDRLGLLEELTEVAVQPRRGVVRDAVTAEVLTELDFAESFLRRYGYPYLVAHRSDVLAVLLRACQSHHLVTLENNARVVGVTEHSGHAEVTFESGESYTAEVLIGADGIRSRVRRLIDSSDPVFSGHIAHRGAISMAQMSDAVAVDDVALWIGPGIHLMQYPVRRGELYNQVAVYESPRYAAGRTDWGTVDELEEMFIGACPAVLESLQLLDTTRAWPVYDREPMGTWSTEHAVLIGDAAHAMLQYLGQGACQALEDALSLARNLANYPGDHSCAFKGYEEQRVAQATKCQNVARPWGKTWHTADPAMLALRNRVFRARAADDYTELDWLYLDRDKDLTVAS